jgi:hypothetical protein
MRRADGTPWIHSFAHGRTIYELKLDAASVRKAMEKAAKADVVKVFTKLAVNAELDPCELEELRRRAAELSGDGVRVIDGALKATRDKHAAQQAKERREHQRATRRDPRVALAAPFDDEPWLPVMGEVNEVLGAVKAAVPPLRDVDNATTRARKLSVPSTHAFSQNAANAEQEEE